MASLPQAHWLHAFIDKLAAAAEHLHGEVH